MSLEETIAEVVRTVVREELDRALATMRDEVLSTEQAAEVARVTPKTIGAWIRSGRLDAGAPPYRIRRSALLAAVERGRPARPASPQDPEALAERAHARLRSA